ncbi:MAG: helix-turn-helix transcriptional regulator [Ruminococcaceae bacterium]|nr:helix-turn-helix transcriptional regulator [Oscillospiraceae bacterium]
MATLSKHTCAGHNVFGTRLKKLRLSKGLSQADLAAQLRILPTTISRYEQGQREPSLDILRELAKCLGVDTNYLLNYPDEPPPQDDLLVKFNTLDERGKSAVLNVLEHEYTQARKK